MKLQRLVSHSSHTEIPSGSFEMTSVRFSAVVFFFSFPLSCLWDLPDAVGLGGSCTFTPRCCQKHLQPHGFPHSILLHPAHTAQAPCPPHADTSLWRGCICTRLKMLSLILDLELFLLLLLFPGMGVRSLGSCELCPFL